MFLLISAVGLTLCAVWLFNIRSLKRLNSAKFKVIHEIENLLPFACYDKEWEIMQQDKSFQDLQQTQIEQFIPLVLAFPYFGLLCYALNSILR